MRDYIDYRVRSVAIVRDDEMRPAFQVICYGLSHSDLASVAMPGRGRTEHERGCEAAKAAGCARH
jgi:hypothetical protein